MTRKKIFFFNFGHLRTATSALLLVAMNNLVYLPESTARPLIRSVVPKPGPTLQHTLVTRLPEPAQLQLSSPRQAGNPAPQSASSGVSATSSTAWLTLVDMVIAASLTDHHLAGYLDSQYMDLNHVPHDVAHAKFQFLAKVSAETGTYSFQNVVINGVNLPQEIAALGIMTARVPEVYRDWTSEAQDNFGRAYISGVTGFISQTHLNPTVAIAQGFRGVNDLSASNIVEACAY